MVFPVSKSCQKGINWLRQTEPHEIASSWFWGLDLNFAFAEIKLDMFAYRELTCANKFIKDLLINQSTALLIFGRN